MHGNKGKNIHIMTGIKWIDVLEPVSFGYFC